MLDFLAALVTHTPVAVWIGLALLVYLGMRQRSAQRVGVRRLVVLPVVLTLASALSAWQAFAAAGEARMLAAWLVGLALGLGLGRLAGLPRGVVANADGTFLVPGSVVPLMLMLLIFLVRYVVNVALAVSPELGGQATFVIGSCLAYGLPSGLFAARARHVLSARRAGGAAPLASRGTRDPVRGT